MFDFKILYYQDIFQLHVSLWIEDWREELDEEKSVKPYTFPVGCQE